jgi:hypothetical protein
MSLANGEMMGKVNDARDYGAWFFCNKFAPCLLIRNPLDRRFDDPKIRRFRVGAQYKS